MSDQSRASGYISTFHFESYFFFLHCPVSHTHTHTHTHTQRGAYGVISVAIQTALYVFVLMQICRLLVFIFTHFGS